MSDSRGPRRGRHSSDDGTAGVPASSWTGGVGSTGGAFDPGFTSAGYERSAYEEPLYEPSRYEPPAWRAELSSPTVERSTGGFRRVSGLLDRQAAETGPVIEPDWWAYGSSDHPDHPLSARHHGERPGGSGWESGVPSSDGRHPSAPLPPPPPGVWDRLHPRHAAVGDDAETVAQPLVSGRHLDRSSRPEQTAGSVSGNRSADDDETDAHQLDPQTWEEETGGLEVIGAHVEEMPRRGRWRRSRHAAEDARPAYGHEGPDVDGRAHEAEDPDLHDADPQHSGAHRAGLPDVDEHDAFTDEAFTDEHEAFTHDDEDPHGHLDDDDIPVAPYDPRTARARRRRRPVAVLFSLLVLGGLVVGIVLGGQKLLAMIDPSSRDYAGQGTGSIEIRVREGDTLSDIARTLVDADVVASIGPFIDAAEAEPAAMGIQPGVYGMRQQMSGRAALDLLLEPVSRLVSRVTVPEGLTVQATLTRLAEMTGTPVEELQAAAADPAALGLPAYANGALEGFLFPATYDFEPDDTAVDMLRAMVARADQAFASLQIPVEQRLTVITKASIVQAEASSLEDMAKVARVLENRLSDGMPLQLDTTVNYANGKGGITTTPADRANPSPYNTYVHTGLPPGAISNPGEDALRAVLSPADGDWRFFVVVDPHTGDTRFARTAEEHQQNVLLFQQWLREHPEG